MVTGKDKKKVSLVLGSGGARGIAHIGVIQELESQGYVIDSIAGCSIGALVGGVYAAGKLDEFEDWVRAISKVDIVSLLDISWQKHGLVKGDKVINTLVDLVGDREIEDLPISFTAVAADVRNEKEVWLNSGPLFDAIRASISLPLFLTPVKYRNGYLIDGGVLNPVPIAPTFDDDTDITIAVNLGGPLQKKQRTRRASSEGGESPSSFREKLTHYIEKLQDSVMTRDEDDWSVYDIADQAFDAMQSTIARHKLAAYPPDVTIELPRNACGTLDFDRASEMIELGREQTRQSLNR
jgi:NTE family protein